MANQVNKLYGLIGMPLGHSFSSQFFNDKFKRESFSGEYRNFQLEDIGELMELIAEYDNLSGLNVTIPYKQQVIPYLDEISDDAKAIGAVNVVKFIRDNGDLRLKGYNSDFIGFAESLKPLLVGNEKSALVLGSGGASKAVAYALKKLGIDVVTVSRRKSDDAISYSDIDNKVMVDNQIIVNTTPLGMYPKVDEYPDIPYGLITSSHICYDLTYNPEVTAFLRLSAENGAKIKNGHEMLIIQALKSWEIWNE